MAQFAVNKTPWFKLTENKKTNTLIVKWSIIAGFKKKKHNIELIRSSMHSSKPSLSQIVLNGNMIYETTDNQYQFELNIENDEIDILIHQNGNKKKINSYKLYINGNEYNDIIHNKNNNVTNNDNRWTCFLCNHLNYKHSKHCRSCRSKKRKKNINTNWSNNILIPPIPPPPQMPIPPPPPPPPPPNTNTKLIKEYETIINQQKHEISQLKTKLLNHSNTEKEKKINKNAIQKCVINTQEKILIFENEIAEINKNFDKIENEKKNCIHEMDLIFNKIYKQIKKRKKQIRHKLETIINIKKKILSTKQKHIKKKLKITNKIKNELLNNKSDTFDLKQIENKISHLKHTNNNNEKRNMLQFKYDIDYKYLLQSISIFGDIINVNNDTNEVEENKNGDIEIEEWDHETMGDNIEIDLNSENKNVIMCNECRSYSYRSCFGLNAISSGCHHWKLKIVEINQHSYCGWNMLIGVLKLNHHKNKKKNKNNHFTAHNLGYGFIGNANYLTSGFIKDRRYGRKLKEKSIIDVYLDLNKLTLCYKINNIGYGCAYQNLQNIKYCLAVSFCGQNNKIQILDYNHEKYQLK